MLDDELFWAGVWMLVHVPGVAAMLLLRRRSLKQKRVAEQWRGRAAPADREEADDLVVLTADRHRRNVALTIVVGSYLLLGVLVFSWTIYPWIDPASFRALSRLILVVGEIILVGSAWISVAVGDRLASTKLEQQP